MTRKKPSKVLSIFEITIGISAIIACIAAVLVVPEFRRWIGLDSTPPSDFALDGSPKDWLPNSNKFYKGLSKFTESGETDEEIARMLEGDYGSFDDIISLLQENERIENYGVIYRNDNLCSENLSITAELVDINLFSESVGAKNYLTWLYRESPEVDYRSANNNIGEQAYEYWYDKYDENNKCNLMVLYLEYQKFNTMVTVQIIAPSGRITNEDILSEAMRLGHIVEQKIINEAQRQYVE